MRTNRSYLLLTVMVATAHSRLTAQVSVGIQPYGSFNPSSFETTNLGDLNVHFEIPLVTKAGRGLPFSYTLAYDNSVWIPQSSSGATTWTFAGSNGWSAITQTESGSLQYGTGYTGFVSYSLSVSSPFTCGTGVAYIYTVVNAFQYHDGIGSVHNFPDSLFYYSGQAPPAGCGPPSRTTFSPYSHASDGSGYSLSATITSPTAVSGFAVAKAGTALNAPFIPASGTPSSQPYTTTDTNGNFISVSGTSNPVTFTDTLNTTALTISGSATPSSPVIYKYTNPQGGTSMYTVNYSTYSLQTNFGCSGVGELGSTTAYLISTITLPDSTQYVFTYEPTYNVPGKTTGRLQSVKLPAGGTISWAYTPSGTTNNITCSDGSNSYLMRTSSDGSTTYSHSEAGTAWTTTMTDASNNETDLNFQSVNASSGPSFFNSYETHRQTYTGAKSGGTLLQTLDTCYNSSSLPCTGTAIALPINAITQNTTLPTNNLISQRKTTLDAYGNQTALTETDYSPGTPGTLLRQTFNVYASLGNIVDHPSSITVCSGTGTDTSCNGVGKAYAQTVYRYDETAVVGTSGVAQHSNNGVTNRGNTTTMLQFVSAGIPALQTTMTYYDTGTVSTVTDPNGSVTTQSYNPSSSCNYSFPTTTSFPLGLSRSSTWSCNGALQLTLVDENAQTWTTAYNDPNFWRPTQTNDPTNATTNYTYPHSQTSVESNLSFNSGTAAVDILTNLDPYGRLLTKQTKQTPTSSYYDTVQYSYDVSGRPYSSTMPFSAQAQGTGSGPLTTIQYDGMNRQTLITDGGGGTLAFEYQQNNDVVTELGPAPPGENTKKRSLQYDGLGRLESVCLLTTAFSTGCGQSSMRTGLSTGYAYDVMNDVIRVDQNFNQSLDQVRTFTYDGVSRMTSEINPENGTVTYAYDSDSTCNITSRGDLVRKTDNYGNTTCYQYDALHRLTSQTVISGPYGGVTPAKNFVYDSKTLSGNGATLYNTAGRLSEAYTGSVMGKITDAAFSYSTRGELAITYESTPHSAGYYMISASYWANGLIDFISTNQPSFPSYTYVPDGEGRPNFIQASTGQYPVTATTYNINSQPLSVALGSLDLDSFGYDPNTGRQTSYQFTIGTTANQNMATGTITNNANGTVRQVATVDEFNSADSQTCTYSYGDLARLATYNCGSVWGSSYGYDYFGNMTKAMIAGSPGTAFAPTYNQNTNQYSSLPSGTPQYDDNGNVQADGFHAYTWDANGKPISVDTTTMTYDALGRRVEFGSGSSFTQYFYTPYNPFFPAGRAVAQTGASLRLDIPGQGQVVAVSTGVTEYRHPSYQGSEVIGSSPTRTILADGAFTPYGEHYAVNPTSEGYFAGMLAVSPPFVDGYAAVNRLYEYQQARWLSPDPAGLAGVDLTNPHTLNRYAYAGADPANSTDPSGLDNGDCFSTYSSDAQGNVVVTVTCRSNYVTWTSFSFTIPGGGPGGRGGPGGASANSGVSGGSISQRLSCAASFGNSHSIGALFGGGKVAMFFGGNSVSSVVNLGLALTGNGPSPQYPGMIALSGPSLGVPVNDVLRLAGKQTVPVLTSASGFVRGQFLKTVFNAATGSSSITTLAGETALQSGLSAGEFASGVAISKFLLDLGTASYGYVFACGQP